MEKEEFQECEVKGHGKELTESHSQEAKLGPNNN